MVRIAAGFHECPDGVGGFRLAQQDAVHAAAEDLAKLPGVDAHMRGVDAVHRGLDDHRRRAMSRPRRPGVRHAAHVLGKAGHVESAVLHADIHVVGPGSGIDATLRMGQHVAAMRTVVINSLILRQQFDAAVDPLTHGHPPMMSCDATAFLREVGFASRQRVRTRSWIDSMKSIVSRLSDLVPRRIACATLLR